MVKFIGILSLFNALSLILLPICIIVDILDDRMTIYLWLVGCWAIALNTVSVVLNWHILKEFIIELLYKFF
jgi:hypothetical protein